MPLTPNWPIEGVALSTPVAGSLAAYVRSLYNANYTEGRCYPTLAAGKTVVSGINWTLSAAFAVLIPVNTIHVPYHVFSIVIETCDVDGVYELALYHAAAHTLMSTIRFAVTGGFFGNSVFRVPSVQLPAEEQLDMKLAVSGGAAGTITCSVIYRLIV